MLRFPDWLKPQKSHTFSREYNTLIQEELRGQIFMFLLSRKSEDEYFDLEIARRNFSAIDNIGTVIQEPILRSLTEPIQTELSELGWKTQLAFGQTGLFIYSSENPPKTCW